MTPFKITQHCGGNSIAVADSIVRMVLIDTCCSIFSLLVTAKTSHKFLFVSPNLHTIIITSLYNNSSHIFPGKNLGASAKRGECSQHRLVIKYYSGTCIYNSKQCCFVT